MSKSSACQNSIFTFPEFDNEPSRKFEPGDADSRALVDEITKMSAQTAHVSLCVDGKIFPTAVTETQISPVDRKISVCTYSVASPEFVSKVLQSIENNRLNWARTSFEDRALLFLRAAELIRSKYRLQILASIVLSQGKSFYQAEIDLCELIDFIRIGISATSRLYSAQPVNTPLPEKIFRLQYRPLNGFVAAIAPFNFACIGPNLCFSPAILGNAVIWKPHASTIYPSYLIYKAFVEAGMPPVAITFMPSGNDEFARVFANPSFAGLHFVGSTDTYFKLNSLIHSHMPTYKNFPRIVAETSGKNFHFIHHSANLLASINCTVSASFEYAGQKCSACSRVYVPQSLSEVFISGLVKASSALKCGDPRTPGCVVGPVISEQSLARVRDAQAEFAKDPKCKILLASTFITTPGFYCTPAIIQSLDPLHKLMCTEFFAPLLSLYVYPDDQYSQTLSCAATTGIYRLTGSIFATDRDAISLASELLEQSAGNFYINDKCSGAVVGKQPFGGAGMSGTNDKVGSVLNLVRFTSVRTITENLALPELPTAK